MWNDNGICKNCHVSCKECSGHKLNNCTECHDGTYLNDDNKCVPDCGHNKYEEKSNNECEDCHKSCKECSGPKES